MPNIFEIFGYALADNSPETTQARLTATCPFMAQPCDGGGNRYASELNLGKLHELKSKFPTLSKLPAGVCSIQTDEGKSPWVVCPRRLLALGRSSGETQSSQQKTEQAALSYLGYPQETRLGVWSEVKLQYEGKRDNSTKYFDYTFDYLIWPVGEISLNVAHNTTENKKIETTKNQLLKFGYKVEEKQGSYIIKDAPLQEKYPSIIEIMTSSTSGGNKDKRTTIPNAFEDAILGKKHEAPGINYRQVWARMVSQLIVKSEAAISWGGKTVWVVQDRLVDYISETTALNIRNFKSTSSSEVNILSISYGDVKSIKTNPIELLEEGFFSGPIAGNIEKSKESFQDMTRASIIPPKNILFALLLKSKPDAVIVVK